MLTDAQCRNAVCQPDKKQSKLYDAGGLFLEVSPAGSKRWFLKYRVDAKEKKLALGSYPAVTLTAARKARDTAKIQKAEGIDPLQARQVEKLKATVGTGDTLLATASDWLERGQPNWSATHYVREQRNITKDLIPYLGKRAIGSIKPIELLAVIQKVEARGALDVAHRVLITAHGVWCHAVATGRAERDITPDIKKALKPHIKENLPAIIDPAQLAGLLRASEGYHGGPVVRAALKLAPILFQRPGNLRTMRWADIDLDAGLWTIPSENMKRTKAEKINGQAHICPLPRQAVNTLQDIQKLTGHGEYVFPGLRDHTKPMSEAAVSAALHAMGYKDIHTWHGYLPRWLRDPKLSGFDVQRFNRHEIGRWLLAVGFQSRYAFGLSKADKKLAVEKPLGLTERRTLLTIIAALAQEAKININSPGKAALSIEGLTDSMGCHVSKRAIEEHLKKIPDALATRMK